MEVKDKENKSWLHQDL